MRCSPNALSDGAQEDRVGLVELHLVEGQAGGLGAVELADGHELVEGAAVEHEPHRGVGLVGLDGVHAALGRRVGRHGGNRGAEELVELFAVRLDGHAEVDVGPHLWPGLGDGGDGAAPPLGGRLDEAVEEDERPHRQARDGADGAVEVALADGFDLALPVVERGHLGLGQAEARGKGRHATRHYAAGVALPAGADLLELGAAAEVEGLAANEVGAGDLLLDDADELGSGAQVLRDHVVRDGQQLGGAGGGARALGEVADVAGPGDVAVAVEGAVPQRRQVLVAGGGDGLLEVAHRADAAVAVGAAPLGPRGAAHEAQQQPLLGACGIPERAGHLAQPAADGLADEPADEAHGTAPRVRDGSCRRLMIPAGGSFASRRWAGEKCRQTCAKGGK